MIKQAAAGDTINFADGLQGTITLTSGELCRDARAITRASESSLSRSFIRAMAAGPGGSLRIAWGVSGERPDCPSVTSRPKTSASVTVSGVVIKNPL
jgi:hypothetical protein